jgi:glucose uptake protein GlcU
VVTDLPLTLGIIGMALILLGFFMTQSHKWSQDDLKYDLTNFVGSALLVYYGIIGRAWPFVILNGVWGLYSLKDVFVDMKKGRKIHRKR